MLDPNNFSAILALLQTHGYWILLLLMIIEGPIITYVAAFAAALGIFNIYWVFILSILGNSIPDKILYFIGRMIRTERVERFVEVFGLNPRRIKTMERHLTDHLGKTLIFSKLVPPLPVPAVLLSGFIKVDFKRFFIITTVFDIIASILFVAAGYFSGLTADNALRYFRLESIILPILAITTVLLYYLIKWTYKKLSRYFK